MQLIKGGPKMRQPSFGSPVSTYIDWYRNGSVAFRLHIPRWFARIVGWLED